MSLALLVQEFVKCLRVTVEPGDEGFVLFQGQCNPLLFADALPSTPACANLNLAFKLN